MILRQQSERLQRALELFYEKVDEFDDKWSIASLIIEIEPTQQQQLPFSIHKLNLQTKWKHIQLKFYIYAMNLHLLERILNQISPYTIFLTELRLVNVELNDICMKLIKEANWKFISTARLNKNLITWKGIKQLIECNWKYLGTLYICRNPIRNKGVEALCKANWPHLKHLNLSECQIDTSAIKVLCKGLLSNVISLDLSKNCITNDAFRYFAKTNLRKLNRLVIQSTPNYTADSFPINIFKMVKADNLNIQLIGSVAFLFPYYQGIKRLNFIQ